MQIHRRGAYVAPQPSDFTELTPKGQLLLNALREVGDWINRSTIASLAGKSALNKWDLVLLTRLDEAGLIETQQIPHHGPIGYEWQYRAIQSGNNVEQDQ